MRKSHRKGISLEQEYGKERAAEIRQKLSESHRGKRPTAETREKMSKALLGNKNGFQKGHIPWNKGKSGYKIKKPKIDRRKIKAPWNKGKNKETDRRIALQAEWMKKYNPACREEVRKKISESLKGRFCGELNPSWIDGRSYKPYPPEFKQLRAIIRQRDDYKCQICGVPERECIRQLEVHHIDEQPENNSPENLISLCTQCHLSIRRDREFWRMVLSNIARQRSKNYVNDKK